LKEDKIEITPVDANSIGQKGWTPELYALLKLSRQGDRSAEGAEIDALIEEALNNEWSGDCD
jgi:hypothetical protein